MKRKILTLATVLFAAFAANAQDDAGGNHTVSIVIPEVALLDIEGALQAITLNAIAPTEAGEALDMNDENSTLWLNYSSIRRTGTDATRSISAAITAGTVPGGLELKIIAAGDAGNGEGTVGTPNSIVTLSGSGQDIISGIGSAYTGSGTSNGHALTYSMVALSGAAYGDLDADQSNTALTVSYTLSDN